MGERLYSQYAKPPLVHEPGPRWLWRHAIEAERTRVPDSRNGVFGTDSTKLPQTGPPDDTYFLPCPSPAKQLLLRANERLKHPNAANIVRNTITRAHNNKGPADLARVVAARLNLQENVLLDLFECMYYASLKTEEARQITLSVTFVNPHKPDPNPPPRIRHDRWSLVRLSEAMELTVPAVTKLAAGSDPRSSSIAVYPGANGRLMIWERIDQQNRQYDFIRHETDGGPQLPGEFQAIALSPGHVRVVVGQSDRPDREPRYEPTALDGADCSRRPDTTASAIVST